jgi:hypothetical protein
VKRRNARIFWHTLVVLLSLTLLVTCGICTEYNMRRVLGQPPELFGQTVLQPPKSVWGERLCWLLEPTGRLLVTLFEWECQWLADVIS